MKTKQIGIIGAVMIGIAIAWTMTFFSADLNQDIQVIDTPYAIDASTLQNKIKEKQIFVVDIRDEQSYAAGHIPGSSFDYLYDSTLDKRVGTIQSRLPDVASTAQFVLIDEDGKVSNQIAQSMSENGIKTFYLEGGIESWGEELKTTSTPKKIDASQLYSKIQQNEDIYLLDVREPSELEVTKISSSVNIPLADVFSTNQIEQIPDDKPVVVICASGNRATIATYALALEGIDFQVLEGGINAWDSFLEENNLNPI
ncbi:hypothetical protein C6988_05670 [Nitrosopumilus sp. b1]|uniref:rhodanese-like domain-containing protein n=1 Tax=Nitrosopumilus sp. b1 TaxID=2109907 RepID=UPI0015F5D38A|nr:rhodanese-like domain-containing protein [Nitrosopumilus sp. b1]KAF6242681.1 hypothetical protein C6988_05670 [Nitrosopumilus sp. b1]